MRCGVIEGRQVLVVLVLLATMAVVGWFVFVDDSSSDPPKESIPEFDVDDLADRLNGIQPYDGHVDADPDRLPTELRYLMTTYGLDMQGAVAQFGSQAEANVAHDWLRDTLGDDPRIGGMRIDHGRGGNLVVHVSDAELGRAILAATAELLPIHIQVTSVSEKELETIARQATQLLELLDTESRRGAGVPYYTVSVELRNERVVIGQSSLAPDELRQRLEPLAHNPLVVVEDLGPVLMEHGGDE